MILVDTVKCILIAASEDNFILEIFLNDCFSKTAAKYIFKNSRLQIFYISYFDLTLRRDEFLWIFLSKGFDEKCKQTELASFKNSILAKKTHFLFIIVE